MFKWGEKDPPQCGWASSHQLKAFKDWSSLSKMEPAGGGQSLDLSCLSAPLCHPAGCRLALPQLLFRGGGAHQSSEDLACLPLSHPPSSPLENPMPSTLPITCWKIQSIISSSDPLDWLPHGPFHTVAPKNLQSHHTSNESHAPSPKFPHPLGSSGVLPYSWGPASSSGVLPNPQRCAAPAHPTNQRPSCSHFHGPCVPIPILTQS